MFVSSAHIMKMAEALDLTNAKTMNARGAEYVGRENHAVFRSVVGLLLWLSLNALTFTPAPSISHSGWWNLSCKTGLR